MHYTAVYLQQETGQGAHQNYSNVGIEALSCTLYSSSHVALFSLLFKCHEENCSDVISSVWRQSTNEIQKGRPSALYLNRIQKLYQPMGRV